LIFYLVKFFEKQNKAVPQQYEMWLMEKLMDQKQVLFIWDMLQFVWKNIPHISETMDSAF
jgi:glucose-6-phosphate 1-dehydrogenase